MLSSIPTTQPTGGEGTPNPSPQNILFLPSYQLPSGYLNLEYQPSLGQQPFTSSETSINSHSCQENTETINAVTGMESTSFHKEGKVLGAIQIMIGLLHIGLGSILGSISITLYGYEYGFDTTTFISGYPFVGGLLYITTGIVSVSTIYQPSICMLHGIIGMNIVCVVLIVIGVILLTTDVSLNGMFYRNILIMNSGIGMSVLLIIFSVLEFAISCVIIHFARLALPVCRANTSQPVWFAPTTSTVSLLTEAPPTVAPTSDNPLVYTIHF